MSLTCFVIRLKICCSSTACEVPAASRRARPGEAKKASQFRIANAWPAPDAPAFMMIRRGRPRGAGVYDDRAWAADRAGLCANARQLEMAAVEVEVLGGPRALDQVKP